MKRAAREQLSLWDALIEQITAPAQPLPILEIAQAPACGHSASDIAAMQAYILAWGARHNFPGFSFPFSYPPKDSDEDRRFGLMYRTRAGYLGELAKHMQRSRYPGEWEEKCIEQLHRFDRGVNDSVWLWLPDYGYPSERAIPDDEE